ncbi:mannose-1-phosphate guanylyltransferase [Faecalicatena orotica]|uniref:mannose-1-phosphate guanylyltransferase n=1 Tax=Faecalicatena orotica TaxID=1544 RepID=UPI00321657F1
MKKTALIMAGGKGERFWPKSRKALPKQFLSLTDDDQTMIQLTVKRILPLVDIEDIYIVTNKIYKDLVQQQLPGIPISNIICEPAARNTAPCIGLGALYISKKYEEAIMYVLPSDHLIKNPKRFIDSLDKASTIANSGSNLVTLGITPNYPETGYGYIKYNSSQEFMGGYSVDQFVEKPSVDLAEEYLDKGNYLWNSGMFIWKISSILDNIARYIPDTYQKLLKIKAALGSDQENTVLHDTFIECKSESIDYAIMEHASNIYTIPENFGWDDVGSWLALERHNATDVDNNIKKGSIISIDTHNCIIEGSQRLIGTIGIENLIIVDTEDSLLICTKNECGKIKDLLSEIKKSHYSESIL